MGIPEPGWKSNPDTVADESAALRYRWDSGDEGGEPNDEGRD